MPYQSPGGSIVAGISAGAAFMHNQQQEQDRRDQMAYERSRDDRLDQMHQAQIDFNQRHTLNEEQRENNKDMLNGLHEERQVLDGQGQAMLEAYGNDWHNVPVDARNAHAARIADFNSRFDGAMQSVYGAKFKEWTDQGQSHMKNMATGDVDPTNPDHGQQTALALVAGTQRDPAEFLKTGQEPSAVERHLASLHSVMDKPQGGDHGTLSEALNGILGNQVMGGQVGRLNPLGGTITNVGFNQDKPAIPSQDGSGFHPALSMSAQHSNGAVSNEPYAASTVPGDRDRLHNVSPDQVMDYCGRLGSVAAICSHPAVQDSLRKALQNPDQSILDLAQAQTALGNSLGKKGAAHPEHVQWEDKDGLHQRWYSVGNNGADWKLVHSQDGASKAQERQPQTWEQEADSVIANKIPNPDNDNKPFANRGEWLAFKSKVREPPVTPAQAREESHQAEEDAERDYGAFKDPVQGYQWTTSSAEDVQEGEPGYHKANTAMKASEIADMQKVTKAARDKAYADAISSRRAFQSRGGGGIAPPGGVTSAEWMTNYSRAHPGATDEQVAAAAEKAGLAHRGDGRQINTEPPKKAPTKSLDEIFKKGGAGGAPASRAPSPGAGIETSPMGIGS
jgi:hypothetical protein